MAHPRKALVLVPLVLLCLAPVLSAQAAGSPTSSSSAADLKDGLDLFRDGQFEKAIPLFRKVVLDPAAGAMKADAYLLIAKSAMAIGKLDDAGSALDIYLASYPEAGDRPEAVYQKGRLLFMQDNFEASLQLLQSFIAAHPGSPFVSSAWFWAGECLYSLGRLEDAQAMYAKIVDDFPTSVKVEAARYKIELINVRRKEVELARLLKWSHEELLRTVEDFQNREKANEQAIQAYQKRVGGAATADLKTIADLRQQLAQKTDEAARLSAQLAAGGAAASSGAPSAEQLARLQQTLAAKAAALALKEQYLGLIDGGGGN